MKAPTAAERNRPPGAEPAKPTRSDLSKILRTGEDSSQPSPNLGLPQPAQKRKLMLYLPYRLHAGKCCLNRNDSCRFLPKRQYLVRVADYSLPGRDFHPVRGTKLCLADTTPKKSATIIQVLLGPAAAAPGRTRCPRRAASNRPRHRAALSRHPSSPASLPHPPPPYVTYLTHPIVAGVTTARRRRGSSAGQRRRKGRSGKRWNRWPIASRLPARCPW